jgi:hypothetical protein
MKDYIINLLQRGPQTKAIQQIIVYLINGSLIPDKEGWMSIVTAPVDGTEIILGNRSTGQVWMGHAYEGIGGKCWEVDDRIYIPMTEATHWQPKPCFMKQ